MLIKVKEVNQIFSWNYRGKNMIDNESQRLNFYCTDIIVISLIEANYHI
jgi:hypothetical protein